MQKKDLRKVIREIITSLQLTEGRKQLKKGMMVKIIKASKQGKSGEVGKIVRIDDDGIKYYIKFDDSTMGIFRKEELIAV